VNVERPRARVIQSSEAREEPMAHDRGVIRRFVDQTIGSVTIDLHMNKLKPGAPNGPNHRHNDAENVYFILSGTLTVRFNGQRVEAKSGDAVFIPRGTPHSASNESGEECIILEMYAPTAHDFEVVVDSPS
jgi:mannose-6-phosphate isomerase-like protein (cupin superfamily)